METRRNLTVEEVAAMSQLERETLYVSNVKERLDEEVQRVYDEKVSDLSYEIVNNLVNSLIEPEIFAEIKKKAMVLAAEEWTNKISKNYVNSSREVIVAAKKDLIRKHIIALRNMMPDRAEFIIKQCILLIGNPVYEIGKESTKYRRLDGQSIIKGLAARIGEEYNLSLKNSVQVATEIIATFDRIMYKAVREKTFDEQGGEYETTMLICSWKLEVTENDLPALDKFPLPILNTKPKDWKYGQRGGGYLTDESKVTLNKGYANQPQNVLDVINILQNNVYTLEDRYDQNEHIAYLMDRFTKRYPVNVAAKITKNIVNCTLDSFAIVKSADIRFQWKFDFRGRMYCVGYNLTLQGNSYDKGLLNPIAVPSSGKRPFNRKDRGLYWRAVDIANKYGLDKKTFEERVDWVENNIDNLEHFIDKAEAKKQFKEAVINLRKELNGIANGQLIALDASNQALQMYSVLLSCSETARTCNLNNETEMADAYRMLADELNEVFNTDVFNRTNCKKALMTTMYAKLKGWTVIPEKMFEGQGLSKDKAIEKLLGILKTNVEQLHEKFWEALRNIAPTAIKAMSKLQQLNDGKDTYWWTLPDGFIVKYDVKQTESFEHQTVNRYGTKFEAKGFREVYAGSEYARGMSPNIIHSIDGWVAREMIRRMNGKFITTIHDAFHCRPEDVDLMRKNYADILCKINNSTMLQDIMNQIAGYRVESIKANTLTDEMIRKSIYSLG